MGLFGRKKTPEEILAEGRAQFVKGDLKKSFITLHGLAAKGNPKACYYIGRIYLQRKEKNLAQSFLTTAAKGGEQDAAALLAKEFDIRDYLPKDTPAAEPGAADADVTADEAMNRGLKAYNRKDYAEAMSWWRKAEMLGSARAPLMIGVLFSNGFGFPKDAAKGLQYFLKAAEQGVAYAQLCAAAKYESGADGVPQDLEKAVYWYEKAAEQGEAAAQHNLALLYANGRGTAQDYEKARYWLQKSAAQDEEVSEYSRGALAQLEEMMSKSAPKAKTDEELCDEGARAYAEKNYAAAVQIWRQLAEKGMARAQDCLALLYYRGDGVEKDEKKSAEWYRKAAEQGRGSSCFNLAIFYERGIGVTKDLNEALRWAEKAKAVGAERADNLIAEIRHNIEAEENRKNLTKPSAPKPGDDLSPEEKYRKGMEMFRAGRYEEAYKLLDAVCSIMYFSSEKDENIYPAGQSAMGWMCETGNGTKIDVASASMYYLNAINNATGIPDKNGMAGFVRLTAKATSPSLKDCEAALDYAKQLGTREAKKAVSTLEQKLAEAQLREKYAELDLNEANVQAIFNRCLAAEEVDAGDSFGDSFPVRVLNKELTSEETPLVFLSDKSIRANKQTIKYLLGQINIFHKYYNHTLILQEGFKKYDGTFWTKDYDTLFQLYALAFGSGYLQDFSKLTEGIKKGSVVAMTATMTPTLSPRDPAFPAWWEAHKGEWEN